MNSRRIERDKSLAALYPQLSAEWCYDKNAGLTPYDILPHSNRKIWWRCKQGHKWQATPCHRTKHSSGCPYCSGRYAIKGENDLETLYPDLVKEWNYEKNGNLRVTASQAAIKRSGGFATRDMSGRQWSITGQAAAPAVCTAPGIS